MFKPKTEYGKKLLSSIPSPKPRKKIKEISKNKEVFDVQQLKVYFPIKKGLFKRTVGHVKAVDGISFSVKQGETVGLVGQSGSGKTTAAMAVLSLIERTSGDFTFVGRKINDASIESMQFLRRNMRRLSFQDPYASFKP